MKHWFFASIRPETSSNPDGERAPRAGSREHRFNLEDSALGLVLTLTTRVSKLIRRGTARRPPSDGPGPPPQRTSDLMYEVVAGDAAQPFFFCGVRSQIAHPGRWPAPCALYALASWAPGRPFIEHRSIQKLAATHVQNLRKIQPNGPYMLGGYCHWALVAYEIAQQLQALGEQVSLLFLVDPMPVNRVHPPGGMRATSLGSRYRDRMHVLLKGPQPGAWLAWLYLFLPAHAVVNRIRRRYEFLSLQRGLQDRDTRQRPPFQRIFDAYWRETGDWFRHYKSAPYDGPCRIMLTNATPAHLQLDQFGGDLQVRSMNCGHAEIFKPHAMDQWVPWLTDEIRVAQVAASR